MNRSRKRRYQLLRAKTFQEKVSFQRYVTFRFLLFKLRYGLKLKYKVLASIGFAGLTGLSAQVWIPLPFTPIPITMQVFTVLLAGVLLGGVFGGLSQLVYVGLGSLGIPWFAGLKSGLPWTFASGGYLFGFIVAAYVVGKLTDKFIRLRYFYTSLLVMFFGVLIIYSFGLTHLYFFFNYALSKPLTVLETFLYGAIPFIPGDIMKAVIAALIVGVLCPKQPYNGEVDIGKTLTTKTRYVIVLSIILGLFIFALAYFWWCTVGWIKPLNLEFAKICLTSSITMIVLGILAGKIFEKKIKQ